MEMPLFVVTVKMVKGWRGPHDPTHKVRGECVNGQFCTDLTGAHHSFLHRGLDAPTLTTELKRAGFHVTRVEGPVEVP